MSVDAVGNHHDQLGQFSGRVSGEQTDQLQGWDDADAGMHPELFDNPWESHGFTGEQVAAAVHRAVRKHGADKPGMDRDEVTGEAMASTLVQMNRTALRNQRICDIEAVAMTQVKGHVAQLYSGTSRGPDITAQRALNELTNKWPITQGKAKRPLFTPADEASLRTLVEEEESAGTLHEPEGQDRIAREIVNRWNGPQKPLTTFHRKRASRTVALDAFGAGQDGEQALDHQRFLASPGPTPGEHTSDRLDAAIGHAENARHVSGRTKGVLADAEVKRIAIDAYLSDRGIPPAVPRQPHQSNSSYVSVKQAGGPCTVAGRIADGTATVAERAHFAAPWGHELSKPQVDRLAESVCEAGAFGDALWNYLNGAQEVQ